MQYLWTGLVPLLLGSQRRLVSAEWLLSEGCRAGLGRGEARRFQRKSSFHLFLDLLRAIVSYHHYQYRTFLYRHDLKYDHM